MKSVVGQVGCVPLCCFFRFRAWLDLSLGVAFVGAARRSLAHDSRSELGDRQWRRRLQRTLPLLVSLEGSGSRIGRPNDSTHTTIRGVDAFSVHASSHLSMRVLIRADDLLATFVLATLSSAWRGTAWSLTKRSRTPCQVIWGGLSKGLGWPCLFVRSLSSHFRLVVALFSKSRWSHSFCRRPASDHVT